MDQRRGCGLTGLLVMLGLMAMGLGGVAWAGERIVYTARVGQQLWIMKPDGSERRQLTYGSVDTVAPDVRPDGKQVVFHTNKDENGDIGIINTDGSGARTLLATAESETYPVWSPDGTQIVFTSQAPDSDAPEIWVMNADGTNRRNLTNNPAGDYFADWSPNGRTMVFCSDRNTRTGLYLMDADGANVRPLLNIAGACTDPDWNPDGSRITFTLFESTGSSICVINADGSGFKRLIGPKSFAALAGWSVDGSHLVFNLGGELHTMGDDGSDLRNVSLGQWASGACWYKDSEPNAPSVDLRLSATARPQPFKLPASLNNLLTIELSITNSGTAVATSVKLSDTLPVGLTRLMDVQPSNLRSATRASGRTVSIALGTLAPGQTRVVRLLIAPTMAGTFLNTARVAGTETDATPQDNAAQSSIEVRSR